MPDLLECTFLADDRSGRCPAVCTYRTVARLRFVSLHAVLRRRELTLDVESARESRQLPLCAAHAAFFACYLGEVELLPPRGPHAVKNTLLR